MTYNDFMNRKHNFHIIILSIFALLSLLPVSAQSTESDLLLYFDTEKDPPSLTVFNPITGEKIPLPVMNTVGGIRPSGDGRIAYIEDNDVWVLDVLNSPNTPINISQTPDEQEWLRDWTPDSHLLEYTVGSFSEPNLLYTYDGNDVIAVGYGDHIARHWNDDGWYVTSDRDESDNYEWLIWNGQESINIQLPPLASTPEWQTFLWTPENYLFITIGYKEREYMQPIGATQVFYWNGDEVAEVIRPSDDETFILGDWSLDGRLTMYTTSATSSRTWYIWDGMSFTESGIPDTASLTAINNAGERISEIDWMPDGRLAIAARANAESDTLFGQSYACHVACMNQVYLWDENNLDEVTYHQVFGFYIDVYDSNNLAVLFTNGLVTSAVVVYDRNLDPIFSSGGPYTQSRWSIEGYLAYCHYDDLLVWDGEDSTLLSRRTSSKWLIADSYEMTCSTG